MFRNQETTAFDKDFYFKAWKLDPTNEKKIKVWEGKFSFDQMLPL